MQLYTYAVIWYIVMLHNYAMYVTTSRTCIPGSRPAMADPKWPERATLAEHHNQNPQTGTILQASLTPTKDLLDALKSNHVEGQEAAHKQIQPP